MHEDRVWSRRDLLARSTALAAGLAVPVLASCSRTSSDDGGGASLLKSLKERGSVNVGINGDAPFGYIDKRGRVTGEAAEVARACFKRLGVDKVKATQVSFEQLIPGLNARQFDMVCAGLFMLPERCKNAQFSRPDYVTLYHLLVPKGNPKKVNTLADAARKQVKIGVISGSAEGSYARAAGIKAAKMATFENDQQRLQAIVSGRIYAVALTGLSLEPLLKDNPDAPVEVTPAFKPIVNGNPVVNAGGFVFRKDDTDLVEAFNRELKAIHDNGDWLKIVKPFGFTKVNLPPADLTTQQLCHPE